MRTYHLILLALVSIIFVGCNKNDDAPKSDVLTGTWNLKNVSGGFAGINEDFDQGKVIWTFNAQNATLLVKNNSTNGIFAGPDTGSYSYAILNINGNQFLKIGNEEYGSITFEQKELLINQNIRSTGSGADLFSLKLGK